MLNVRVGLCCHGIQGVCNCFCAVISNSDDRNLDFDAPKKVLYSFDYLLVRIKLVACESFYEVEDFFFPGAGVEFQQPVRTRFYIQHQDSYPTYFYPRLLET